MRFDAVLSDALEPALCRGAFFAETHAIKGLLALDRLQRMAGFERGRLEEMLGWNQLLQAPTVEGLFSDQLHWSAESLTDHRLRRLIEGAVFPMSYLAGVEWVRRHGYAHLVDSFRALALSRTGYLGHAWTIWCSFLEVTPYLETSRHQFLAAERFVEFAASQLSTPDWLTAYDVDLALVSEAPAEDVVIDAVLERPGYFGHRLITLAYLYKYRQTLTLAQWTHGLRRTHEATLEEGATDRAPEAGAVPSTDAPAPDALDAMVLRYLGEGPKEVHTLTLADGARELWQHLGPGHRVRMLEVFEGFCAWKVERAASGERKAD